MTNNYYFEKALNADINDKIGNALTGYYKAIAKRQGGVEPYINAIVIMAIVSWDHGLQDSYIRAKAITKDQITKWLDKDLPNLISEATNQYPNDPELQSWLIYLDELHHYKDQLNSEKMQGIISKYLNSIFPKFYLYVFCEQGRQEYEEALALYFDGLGNQPIFKDRHMLSFFS